MIRIGDNMKKNKKIGILTFHASHNCGSMMQAYATQQLLNKLGYDNEIINFQNEGQRDMYAVIHKKLTVKNLIKNSLLWPHYFTLKRHWNDYEEFLHNTFILSKEKFEKTEHIDSIKDLYDACICGADQIWNITIKDADDAYFLPFEKGNMKKISYAPSFGAKEIAKHTDDYEKYNNYLSDFDFLSIRENNGQKWIKKMIGKEVPVVLDSTLMIDESDYEKIRKSSGIKGKYIFYYAPTYSKKLDKFVKQISKKYNIPVVVWNSREYFLKGEYLNGFKMPVHQEPGIYLDLIKNAELVITTSFHGTIFSTIERKKFWILKNGGMYTTDDRVITLVNQLCVSNRLIEPNFDASKDYFEEVDYNEYEKNLKMLREHSLNYLKESLE